ncbi:unnamed protein product [Leptosia nina]|uniref:Uncharacterized protein n=1 Tax=Leptosia nina TaxID=320188 RepID=A0AAV1IS62_9NEOP
MVGQRIGRYLALRRRIVRSDCLVSMADGGSRMTLSKRSFMETQCAVVTTSSIFAHWLPTDHDDDEIQVGGILAVDGASARRNGSRTCEISCGCEVVAA